MFENNAQQFETVCFSMPNTFPIAYSNFFTLFFLSNNKVEHFIPLTMRNVGLVQFRGTATNT